MNDSFHIISKLRSIEDWEQHEAHEREQKLALLEKTTDMADQRDLGQSAKRFRPSDELLNAINAALAARVPLLLTGEPGTGKTQVAWYIQRYLDIPLFGYQVHSNSQAADMRYDFDAVAYLRDAYLAREDKQIEGSLTPQTPSKLPEQEKDPRSNPRYLKPGALWKAYDPAVREEKDQHKKECVLLIDEIDKAPRDFPNDLLQELDQHQFAHPFESNQTVKRKGAPPIIIVTSNGERRLPDAFLRRCMVHHIELTSELLTDIMQAWENQFPHLKKETRKMAQQRFEEIRKEKRLSKLPGSAELLLWLSVLSAQNKGLHDIDEKIPLEKLPALLCLIKDHSDRRLLKD